MQKYLQHFLQSQKSGRTKGLEARKSYYIEPKAFDSAERNENHDIFELVQLCLKCA